jgi:aminomethyltransferase
VSDQAETLRTTPLTERHRDAGARMSAFAGYDMPIQYELGVLKEHLHTREKVGLFDVSHMGQAYLMGAGAAAALEVLVPGDIQGLGVGRQRYTVLLNDQGGIIDDLMVLKLAPDLLFLVVNAVRKEVDFAYFRSRLPRDITLEVLTECALVALQGPLAESVLKARVPEVASLSFMQGLRSDGLIITRSGYTGEDGFELSIPTDESLSLIDQLAAHEAVQWIGLGARDSLRLEAGLSLYGHELDETISPVEADLSWVIGKKRREAGGFAGSERIMRELQEGPARKRVGIRPEGRIIAREHTVILNAGGNKIGEVTSGGFGPSVNGPIAMGYVESAYAAPGTPLQLVVRGQTHPASVSTLPFTPHRYKK